MLLHGGYCVLLKGAGHGAHLTPNTCSSQCLYFLARSGGTAIAAKLLQHRAEVDKPTLDGCTPLIAAATEGNLEVVELLLSHNANVNASTVKGDTVSTRRACTHVFCQLPIATKALLSLPPCMPG